MLTRGRILAFDIDGDAPVPFTVRLARTERWSLAYARRVVDEYRRFLFLAAIAGPGLSPSLDVDRAWHLHLLDTHSYWEALCRDTIGKPIHHVPWRGEVGQRARFERQYESTLRVYVEQIGAAPPEDIWPRHRFPRRGLAARLRAALATFRSG